MKRFFRPLILAGVAGLLPAAAGGVASAATAADVPLKIVRQVEPSYPLRLLNQGIGSGAAGVLLLVDARGRLADVLVTSYTHPEFAATAVRAVHHWRFEPGSVDGQPVDTVVRITFLFSVEGVLVVDRKIGDAEAVAEYAAGRNAFAPCPADRLDRRPAVVHLVPPAYPKDLGDQGIAGSVRIQYYIDQTGRVRFPFAVGTADRLLAGLAIMALRQWRFEPPTSQGRPVLVQASQEFSFVATE